MDSIAIIENTTISGNKTDANGGGLGNGGDVTLDNMTITDNTADEDNAGGGDGGGIFNDDASGTISLRNTLLAENFDPSSDPDCFGTITSAGFNLIETHSAGCLLMPEASDIIGEAPLIDALADNGGSTQTHALEVGSPAIDAGDCTDTGGNPITEDQRGTSRPQQGDCDIGAFEFEVVDEEDNVGDSNDQSDSDQSDAESEADGETDGDADGTANGQAPGGGCSLIR